MILWVEHGNSKLTPWLAFSPWVQRLYLRLHPIEPEVVVMQALWSFLLATLIFLVLRILARFSPTSGFLSALAGLIALVGFPLVALRFPALFNQPEPLLDRFAVGFLWLYCEVALSLICGLLYYLRKWPLPAIPTILLLILHFSFWAWLTGEHVNLVAEARSYGSVRPAFWIAVIFYWGFPVFGFLSSLIWGLYVRPQASETFPKRAAVAP